ncbi:GNAT family N-acetyltransferase [Corynebacterium poyangense]|uniref:GNAT family N-acetyltransferase n=1 Tax=Corynebacterium poyangense TaxID=2684405 RepID=A0A7H0SL65_9CORY|nr:GNAT family N-acetyltransferase [Corynebacterium poyangense]QNQ89290.1 GNAT family N-acetyltransferase [Corynebacterium poyangense]
MNVEKSQPVGAGSALEKSSASARWEADVILNDGGIATLRSVAPGDGEALRRFYSRVSDRSKYLRFFSTHPELSDEDLERWMSTDSYDKVTLVMVERDSIIAVAGYEIVPEFLPARVGDVSFLVQDSHHSRGVGNILLEHLAEIGREGGVERFFAEMLTQNRQMAQVFIRAGYSATPELADGFVTVDFTIEPNVKSREVMERREMRAEANSIRRLLNPASVAVIGEIDGVRALIPSLVTGRYQGQLHIVTTPTKETSVAEGLDRLSSSVDLVLVEHNPEQLDQIMAAAARKNATGLVIFANSQNPGLSHDQARDVVLKARDYGLRALGPAALGLINTDPQMSLNATPAPMPRRGKVGLFTQSAGVATLALSHAIERGCGLSSFVGAGLFADVTGNDVIQYWGDDENTDICLLSLDSIGNPRKFFRVLHRLALEKHVVVFIPSRALQSARHYGEAEGMSLEAIGPHALDEVIRQTGSMVVTRRDTMYDIAQLLARQPLPRGNNVAVVSNSAGLTQQMAQSARRFGLEPHPFTVLEEPVSGIAARIEECLNDDGIDAVLATVVEVGIEPDAPVLTAAAERLAELAARTTDTPVIASLVGFGKPDIVMPAEESQGQLPLFPTYADALETLGLIVDNERRRAQARPQPEDEIGEGAKEDALEVVERVLEDCPEGRWATDTECSEILAAYGIDIVPWVAVNNLEEAVAAGEKHGWDVVLKCVSSLARGRSEWPTVIRHIRDAEAMAEAWQTLQLMAQELQLISPDSDDLSALEPVVQTTVATGAALTVRAVEDPVIGPVVSLGISGITNDLLEDKAWRVPPLRRSDAKDMVLQLSAAPLLTGYRGSKPSRLDSVERVIMQLARLKDDIAGIVEVELTPVIAGVVNTDIVGARMRIAPLSEHRDPLVRKIS